MDRSGEIEHYIDIYRDYINKGRNINRNPTFFEVTTEMAFQFYRDQMEMGTLVKNSSEVGQIKLKTNLIKGKVGTRVNLSLQ